MMKTLKSAICLFTVLITVTLMLPSFLWAASLKGKSAPAFALDDINGQSYDIAKLKGNPVVILYFFDASSRSSQEGLLDLDQWTQKYKKADLQAWGITRSDKNSIK
ncbi:MAG: redoxin domain-containing protein, partial [Desulfobacteraceae bacterium]